jgi:hypothetical protein|tara:strand:- start:393 stop:605 length:213 start_codon:yes stop_codon:yes gene_type:complete
MHYGHILKGLQDKSGKTKYRIAKEINMDLSNYLRLLENEDMQISTFHKVCRGLDVTIPLLENLDESVLDL